MGTIADVQTDVVQLLWGRTTITVAFRQVDKSLRAIAGVVLSQRAVSRAHVRRDAAIQQPLQKLPVPVSRIRCDRGRLSSLPLGKTSEHGLCGDGSWLMRAAV